MLVVYDSRTGNVERFVKQLGVPSVKISRALIVNEPFVLVTYTTGFGLVPPTTVEFLKNNGHNLRGVAASGNRNWGKNFCKAADTIAKEYYVPIITKFELAGTASDIENFILGVRGIEVH